MRCCSFYGRGTLPTLIEVSYESDIDRAMEIVKEVVLQEPAVVDKSKGTATKEISVLLESNDSSIEIGDRENITHTKFVNKVENRR